MIPENTSSPVTDVRPVVAVAGGGSSAFDEVLPASDLWPASGPRPAITRSSVVRSRIVQEMESPIVTIFNYY